MSGRSFVLVSISLLALSCARLNGLVRPVTKNPDVPILAQAWSASLDPEYEAGNLPIGLQTPFIHEGLIYVGVNEKGMGAYSLENGRNVWLKNTAGSYHSRPTFYKDHIIYGTSDGRVYSRHYLTGELKYEVDLGATVESEAVIYKDRVFFHLRNHQIFCLDASSGKILWGHKRAVPFLTTIQRASVPVFVENKLIVGHADGFLVAYSIDDGSILWEQKLANGNKFIDVDVHPIYYKGKIYAGAQGGNLFQIAAETGSTLHQFDTKLSRLYSFELQLENDSAPVSYLVSTSTEGDVFFLDEKLHVAHSQKFGKKAITGVTPWRNYLVFGSASRQMFITDQKLKFVTTYDFGHEYSSLLSGPAGNNDGPLAVLTSRNRLYIFK